VNVQGGVRDLRRRAIINKGCAVMEFYPVWISNIEHLDTLLNIYKLNNRIKKLVGSFEIPPNFPYIQATLPPPSHKVYVVFFANGSVNINDNNVIFNSSPIEIAGDKVHNLKENFHFDLESKDISSIERFKHQKPIIQYWNINWIRIITEKNDFLKDFLICVGGEGPSMKIINEQTDKLHTLINNLIK
jgi:hypothetical protein